MPTKIPEPQVKMTWRVNERDIDTLEAYYGPGAVNRVVRELIERHANRVRETLAGVRVG